MESWDFFFILNLHEKVYVILNLREKVVYEIYTIWYEMQ
jgi:hypothetical protein